MLDKGSKCIGLWCVTCDADGYTLVIKADLSTFNYRIDDPEFNEPWFYENRRVSLAVSKKDFTSINWPNYLEPGETMKIRVYQSGNYTIEDE